MKDPAFLFYSKDFYEGTRMMLPIERACYLDLMIYQHQNGFIPNDIERLKLYCSGIDEATLKATLEAKFKQSDKGWINQRLQNVIDERREYSEKQSVNGKVGQYFKKAKRYLSENEYSALRKHFENQSNAEIYEKIKDFDLTKGSLKAMLKASLKHLAIAIANEDLYNSSYKSSYINGDENFDFFILEKNTQWVESTYQMITNAGSKIEYSTFTQLLNTFCTEKSLTDAKPKNEQDYRQHFINWVKIQVTKPEYSRKSKMVY